MATNHGTRHPPGAQVACELSLRPSWRMHKRHAMQHFCTGAQFALDFSRQHEAVLALPYMWRPKN